MAPVRVALIGYGLGGRAFHAPLIRATQGLELTAIATARPVPEGIAAVRDPLAAIADPAIDLVVLATPNATHFPLAKAALEAGKHVVIDKPFAASVAEADALIALATARSRMLTVFHNRRWDGDFRTVRALVESGRLGEIMLCEMYWDRFRRLPRDNWKDAGGPGTGLLFDLGSHLIDQALLLFGPPDSIAADLAVQRAEAIADDYFALILHDGARRIVLGCSTLVAAPRPRFALHGTKGGFVKYGLDPQEAAMDAGATPGLPGFGVEEARWHGVLTAPDGARETIETLPGRYLAFYEGVARAIAGDAPPPVDPAEAREGLRLIELARQSAGEGRRIPC
jgi:scyllo-inositol 2-dehydrogenase (NADP+)